MTTKLETPGLIPGRGYIFNFREHGAFDPDGKVSGQLSQSEIDAHNAALAILEWAQLIAAGRGILYIQKPATKPGETSAFHVTQWSRGQSCKVYYSRWSRHNMAREGRRDVWFILDGSVWHGVNIGNNDICRVKRTKEKAK